MRFGLLITTAFSWLLIGATCGPLADGTARAPLPGINVAVTIDSPANDRSVGVGAIVDIDWSAANLTGRPGTLTLLVKSRTDLTYTIVADALDVNGAAVKGSFAWNTTGFVGAYDIVGRITANGKSSESLGAGRITVQGPPQFEFLAPDVPTDLKPGSTVTIKWNGGGTNTTAVLKLDPDLNHTSGNEVAIASGPLKDPPGEDSINWGGRAQDGTTVTAGTYNLFAEITDGVNPPATIEGLAPITILDANATTLRITAPAENTSFVVGSPALTIAFGLEQSSDVLVDLKVDADDVATNGNEITILSQRLEMKDTATDSFDWNGTDALGGAVPAGIYKQIIVASTGSGAPKTATGPALVFRRDFADQPLIALLTPATPQTVKAGDFVTIKWRDDDPSETATITLTIDDDPIPLQNEPGSSTDMAELTILSGRAAKDDGVSDTFTWQIPSSLKPGTYYVFAYIDLDGVGVPDSHSIAPGQFIIKDPGGP